MTTHPFLELRNLSVWTWRFLTNQDVGEWIVLREGCYLKCVVQTQPYLLRASMLGMVSNTQLWPFLFDPHDMVAGRWSTTRTATQAQWVVVVRPTNDEKEQWKLVNEGWGRKCMGSSVTHRPSASGVRRLRAASSAVQLRLRPRRSSYFRLTTEGLMCGL